MATTEAPHATRTTTGTTTPSAGAGPAGATPARPAFTPVPVWFFAFEGLLGASWDVVKSSHYGWLVLGVGVLVNVVLARTVLRGRLKMARAILKGRRTRKLAVGLIALRMGAHVVLGAVGMEATSPVAHVCFAVLMCATTVGLLAFDQKVMLRALDAEAAGSAGAAPTQGAAA